MDLVNIRTENKKIVPKQKLFIRTFGCQMNEYDSLKLGKILEPGYELAPSVEDADLVLVNTCSVRDKPEHKLYSLLGELRDLKKINPKLMIGVGGCVAQQQGETIIKRSSVVDFVFGTHNLSLVPSLIELRKQGAAPQVAVDYRDEWEDLPAGFAEPGRVSVFISISRGCNKNCTYCIVPTTRGKEVSRPLAEIEREVRIALHRGAKEIVLLGQTVNSYGRDLDPRYTFVQLLERLSQFDGLNRIRFVSPHPQEVRQDFLDLITENPKICRHVHMPMQSGSDRILKAMNRNYRRSRYLAIVESLRDKVPDISLTTDIIVGFPGETDEDFRDTMDIVERVKFDNCFSFVFSPRPGTAAAEMEDPVPIEVKNERLAELQNRQTEISQSRLADWVGKEVEVLIDRPTKTDPKKMQGRMSQNITVNLTKQCDLQPGSFVNCRITAAARYTLKGEPVAASKLSDEKAAH